MFIMTPGFFHFKSLLLNVSFLEKRKKRKKAGICSLTFSRFVGNGRADASCGSFVMWKTRVLRTMMAKRLRIIVRSVRIDDPMKTQEHNANYPVTQHVGTTIKQFGIRRSSVLKSKNKMGFLFNLFTHRKQNKTKNEENTNKQKYLKKMRVKKQ